MIGALLLNEPMPGGVPGRTRDDEAHERAERALENMRADHFARQRPTETIDEGSGAPIGANPVYHIPPIADIQELNLSGVTAIPDEESVDANELALLLIIAEL